MRRPAKIRWTSFCWGRELPLPPPLCVRGGLLLSLASLHRTHRRPVRGHSGSCCLAPDTAGMCHGPCRNQVDGFRISVPACRPRALAASPTFERNAIGREGQLLSSLLTCSGWDPLPTSDGPSHRLRAGITRRGPIGVSPHREGKP